MNRAGRAFERFQERKRGGVPEPHLVFGIPDRQEGFDRGKSQRGDGGGILLEGAGVLPDQVGVFGFV